MITKKSELRAMTVTSLRKMVREQQFQITGAWNMKKDPLVEEIFDIIEEAWGTENDEIEAVETVEVVAEVETAAEVEEEVEETKSRRGRSRTINIFKDDELIHTIEGLINTFKFVEEKQYCNQGWVKRSLKTGEDTLPGRKFKEGGYRFEYAD